MQGNIVYDGLPVPAGGLSAGAANDGLSISSGVAKLGQTGAASGDPAVLTEQRWIPDPNGFGVVIGKNDGINPNALVKPAQIGLSSDPANVTPPQLLMFDGANNFLMSMPDQTKWNLNFGGVVNMYYDYGTGKLNILAPIRVFGARFGRPLSTYTGLQFPLTINNASAQSFAFVMCDMTSASNVVNWDPTSMEGEEMTFVKVDTTANTLTVNCTTGAKINNAGVLVSSVVLSTPGQGIRMTARSNGIIYITGKF